MTDSAPRTRARRRPKRTPAWACLLLWASAVAAPASAGPSIVSGGGSEHRIVIAADAPEAVTAAAALLQSTVREATGAELPIVEGGGFGAGDPVIVLGENKHSRAAGVDLSGVEHDGFRVLTRGEQLFVTGRDDAGDPFSHSLFRSAGTYTGVGWLLHEHLGVRHYLPDPLWHHVPEARGWELPDLDAAHGPEFLRRKLSVSYFHKDPDKARKRDRIEETLAYARFNGGGGGLKGAPQHAVSFIMEPFTKDGKYTGKPEWLAFYDGRRIDPPSGRWLTHWYRFHLCTSNPEVRQIVVDYCRNYFEEKPSWDVVGIGMTDGDRHCECADCRALDAPGSDSLSDRYLDFNVHVAKELKKTHPDKLVGSYVYATYVEPPLLEHDVPDNLTLTHVQNGTYYFSDREKKEALERMDAWSEVVGDLAFYCWPASHGFFSLPLSDPDWVVEHLRGMKENGYVGYASWVSGAPTARQPDTYLLMRMLWDMDRDPAEIVDGFYEDLYGPAAGSIRGYHEVIRERVHEINQTIVMVKNRDDDAVSRFEDRLLAYYAPIMAECRALLDGAAAEAAGDALRSERVGVLSTQFELVEMMIPAIELGRKIDAGEASEGGGGAARRAQGAVRRLPDRARVHERGRPAGHQLHPRQRPRRPRPLPGHAPRHRGVDRGEGEALSRPRPWPRGLRGVVDGCRSG